MKKYFFFAAAALAALASCSKSPVAETTDPDEIFTGSEKYPITFSSNVTSTRVSVKGGGSVDVWNAAQTLYVYGIKRDADGALDLTDGIQIDNIAAAAPDGVTQGAIEVYDPALSTEEEKVPFYYDNNGRYDFFGYYADDAFVEGSETPGLDVDAGTISLPVQIDGTQDVMLAYADRTAAVEGTTIDPARLYSAYGVRKGIVPNLKFEHQLSRFIFKVKKGTVKVEGEEGPQVQPGDLYINSLSVDSYVDGVLTIVGDNRGLAIAEESDSVFLALTNRGEAIPQTLVEGEAKTLGESVMVMPGRKTYNIKFVLENAQGIRQETDNMSFPILNAQKENVAAEAGKSYVITLTVYNLEEIEINVDLTPWDEDTEPINIGEDED